METQETKKLILIKLLRYELESIDFWRKHYVFEESLEFEDVKLLENLIGRVWLEYAHLTVKIRKREDEEKKYP